MVGARLYDWLLLLHLLGAMVWVGGVVSLSVIAVLVLRSGDASAVARFVRQLSIIGPVTLAPSMAAVLAFGIWLVLDSELWSFGQAWVDLGIALFAVMFVIGAVYQSRTAIAAQRAAEAGDTAEAARQLRRWAWGMRAILVLLVVISWDMVLKPGM